VMLVGPRQPDQRTCNGLEAFLEEERPVVQHQQALGDVDPTIGSIPITRLSKGRVNGAAVRCGQRLTPRNESKVPPR
jgi:hypothetical protein